MSDILAVDLTVEDIVEVSSESLRSSLHLISLLSRNNISFLWGHNIHSQVRVAGRTYAHLSAVGTAIRLFKSMQMIKCLSIVSADAYGHVKWFAPLKVAA